MSDSRQSARAVPGETSDLEARLTGRHRQSLRLWLRMLSCTVLIEDVVRGRLRNQFSTTLPRFDLMAQLQREPSGLRMGELSRRMMVTGGNITGITDQLEREGLVVRVSDDVDRRAFRVSLTARGREEFSRMAKQHEAWIDQMLAGLDHDEKEQLIGLLSRVKHDVSSLRLEDENQ